MSEFNLYDGNNNSNNNSSGRFYDERVARQNVFGGDSRRTRMASSDGKIVETSVYFGIITGCLLYGFIMNIIFCKFLTDFFLNIPIAVLLIGYFISCVAGIIISKKSSNPVVSFIGYNLIVIPVGVVLSVVLHGYNDQVVMSAITTTAIVTGFMMVMGILFPQVFERITKALAVALIVTLVVELIMFIFFRSTSYVIDYIVALIFAGYIAVDLGRANRLPHTIDNAVDSAVELYLDIINLFIRILEIMGKKD